MKKIAILALLALPGCGLPALMSGEFFPEDAKLKRLEGKTVYYFQGEDTKDDTTISSDGFVHSDGYCSTLKLQVDMWRNKHGLNYAEDVSNQLTKKTITNGQPDFREKFCYRCVPDPY